MLAGSGHEAVDRDERRRRYIFDRREKRDMQPSQREYLDAQADMFARDTADRVAGKSVISFAQRIFIAIKPVLRRSGILKI